MILIAKPSPALEYIYVSTRASCPSTPPPMPVLPGSQSSVMSVMHSEPLERGWGAGWAHSDYMLMPHPAPQHSLHSLMGSSDQSRQSRAELHTLSKLMHSPLWHLNLLGPSHCVTERGKESRQEGLSCRGLPKMTLQSRSTQLSGTTPAYSSPVMGWGHPMG